MSAKPNWRFETVSRVLPTAEMKFPTAARTNTAANSEKRLVHESVDERTQRVFQHRKANTIRHLVRSLIGMIARHLRQEKSIRWPNFLTPFERAAGSGRRRVLVSRSRGSS